jgi:hypothetical protein
LSSGMMAVASWISLSDIAVFGMSIAFEGILTNAPKW